MCAHSVNWNVKYLFFFAQMSFKSAAMCYMNNCTKPRDDTIIYHNNCTKKFSFLVGDNCHSCLAQTTFYKNCDEILKYTNCPLEKYSKDKINWHIMYYPVIFMSVLGIARELIQILMEPKDYARDWFQNVFELSMYVFALVLGLNLSQCNAKSAFKLVWQFLMGAVAVLFSW